MRDWCSESEVKPLLPATVVGLGVSTLRDKVKWNFERTEDSFESKSLPFCLTFFSQPFHQQALIGLQSAPCACTCNLTKIQRILPCAYHPQMNIQRTCNMPRAVVSTAQQNHIIQSIMWLTSPSVISSIMWLGLYLPKVISSIMWLGLYSPNVISENSWDEDLPLVIVHKQSPNHLDSQTLPRSSLQTNQHMKPNIPVIWHF